eukprot:4324714-Pleurochrysis_carterae.AAC.2
MQSNLQRSIAQKKARSPCTRMSCGTRAQHRATRQRQKRCSAKQECPQNQLACFFGLARELERLCFEAATSGPIRLLKRNKRLTINLSTSHFQRSYKVNTVSTQFGLRRE